MPNKSTVAPAQFKADVEQRVIEGYSSTFGNEDEVGDVVMPGAFKRTLAARLPEGKIVSYYNHVPPLLGHLIDGTAEDSAGLFTRISVTRNPIGTAVLQDIADGHLKRMSIAYDVLRQNFIQRSEAQKAPLRQLQELKLYEAGPVDIPANEQADILTAKAIQDSLNEALGGLPELERIWRQKGFLTDKQRDFQSHVMAAITNSVTAVFKALSADDSEPIAATTRAGDPPPTAGIADPEAKAYEDASLRLLAFKTERALSGLRAAAQG